MFMHRIALRNILSFGPATQPETRLHPEVLLDLVTLLRDISERCQLLVTTHSATLVDALTETPDSVVVCEKLGGQVRMEHLDADDLSARLERHPLGDLWRMGELGANP